MKTPAMIGPKFYGWDEVGKKVNINDTGLSLNSLGLILGLNENTAGKIIKPATKATPVSVIATSFAELGILV